ncbi:FliM/FliN family flagellar motor switch protein [Alkalimonas mucilaginosa]|uniref:FliM/FliN family flagellar motor switch protein n=1 Tax=Alkalimonas mucilaginosa TaxID=3057676 RepID=A0ABU7JF37_9GAMM|nr:FliM/FliN family flagellar motor switch protein [Alkalimonas sp. MEB004]MEE2024051.1 FliM/FliN family flagellar motor switch protein [Alkalimonas sp. MEB004]
MMTRSKIIPAAEAAGYPPFALVLDQRNYGRALVLARQRLPELAQAVELELSRLLQDVEFSIEMNLCQGTGLDSWLAEPGRLLLHCPVLVPTDSNCYLALDYTGVHHLADLMLGGQLSKAVASEDKTELSASELRICSRIAQRQLQAMQQRLFKEQSVLPATAVKQQLESEQFQYLPLKVRLLLDSEAISWYLWLPQDFFIQPEDNSSPVQIAAVDAAQWSHVPVQCSIEMARKKVSLRQLQDCLNGKVLPIELHSAMALHLNKERLLYGKVAEEGNRLVFQITDIVTREQEQ